MDSQLLLYLLIGILSVNYFSDRILSFLNLKRMTYKVPEEVQDVYDEERYKKAQAYHKEKSRFGFLGSTVSFASMLIVLSTGLFGWLDDLVRQYTEHYLLLPLIFFVVLGFANNLIGLPFALYNTFVIEQKYGFNRTSLKTFALDQVKGLLLGVVIGLPLFWLFVFLIEVIGPQFWLIFWGVATLFMIGMNFFYTTLIVPLFNKLKPLEEGELRTAIEKYSKTVDFPLENIFVIDGSKRSSKANAFFSGFGKQKKIVLYDTLIEQQTTEELVAVLAHEAGHYKKKHVYQSFAFSILQIGMMLFLLSWLIFLPQAHEALGAEKAGVHLSLLIYGILFSPLSQIVGILMNLLSRKNEYQADAFARDTYNGEHLISALKKLSRENFANLTPHPALVFLNYSHPPLIQRIRAIRSKK